MAVRDVIDVNAHDRSADKFARGIIRDLVDYDERQQPFYVQLMSSFIVAQSLESVAAALERIGMNGATAAGRDQRGCLEKLACEVERIASVIENKANSGT